MPYLKLFYLFGLANLEIVVGLAAAFGNFRDANDELDEVALIPVVPMLRRDVIVAVDFPLFIDVAKLGIVDFVIVEPLLPPPIVRLPRVDVDVLLVDENFEIAPISTLAVDVFNDGRPLPDDVNVLRTRFTAEFTISRAIFIQKK